MALSPRHFSADQQGLRHRPVGIAKPRLRPGPHAIGTSRVDDRDRIARQPARQLLRGSHSQKFSCAERGEGHRPREGRALLGDEPESGQRPGALLRDRRPRRGDPQAPHRAPPAVAHGWLVAPASVQVHPVVAGSVLAEGRKHECQIALAQPGHHRVRPRLATGDDQAPRDVVDAVAVLATGDGVQRVFEQTALVGQSGEVVEDGVRRSGSRDRRHAHGSTLTPQRQRRPRSGGRRAAGTGRRRWAIARRARPPPRQPTSRQRRSAE